ncbi:group-specific protein [Planococcus kocurii]|uniref:group-specific protein n=1 Tax=Planococcus kocurii TaxID=1374 RepID=UPI003D0058C5
MGQLVQLQLDDVQLEGMIIEELKSRLNNLEHRYTFWDLEELGRQTQMSTNFMKDTFFYDERFARLRFKVGRKWLFPAAETEEFLLMWLKEQQRA